MYHDGRVIDLREVTGTRHAAVLDVNNRDQVLGYVYDTSRSDRRFVLWTLPSSPAS